MTNEPENEKPDTRSPLLEGQGTIGRIVVLPWSKAAEIAIKSIRVRFWRSIITTSSIILAIAFLMSIWTSTCLNLRLTQEAIDRPALRTTLTKSGLEVPASSASFNKKEAGTFSSLLSSIKTRDSWLIVLSLVVCVVGIVNAMLMSVTERFREIGTMKCLGALDKFIVRIFLLESSGLGVIGTAAGILVGFLLTMFRYSYAYGFYPWKYFPALNLFQSAVISLFIGTILSILAAIYPAWTAAKMEPVVAMRVEA